MPNDPRGQLALAALTAMIHVDKEAYDSVADMFEGGASEAFAAMARLAQMLVKMLAETLDVTPEEMLGQVGIAMASYDWE